MIDLIPIKRVLLSVSEKNGLAELARTLNELGAELFSTGGTAAHLRESGLPVLDVSGYTGFPEILDGRVKTLHPKIHGGLLGIRDKNTHAEQMREHGIEAIDMVVVNLYPFREVAARSDSTFDEIIEQIDIGGPSLLRSAAKNHAYVAVVTDPRDYGWVRQEMRAEGGRLSAVTRFKLAQKAFASTASYESAIASFMGDRIWSAGSVHREQRALPALEVLTLERYQDLRYGENPHQRAALYRRLWMPRGGVAGSEVLHGKELSYNNYLDSDAAWRLIQEFDRPSAAIIKHTNPCGVAQSGTLAEAYVKARDADPVSAFGSVVALNRIVDAETAAQLHSTFVEVILAPDFTEEGLATLRQKKSVRLLRMVQSDSSPVEHRQIAGGFLVQERDVRQVRQDELRTVTRRAPTAEETEALLFGWRVVKHVKSNAIVFCNATQTLGIGAGQMSRVDSVKWGAQRALVPLEGSVMASEAFFPFADGILAAASYGIRAVIQPGGSVRDAEVIAAADAQDMAMVFTDVRHFRH